MTIEMVDRLVHTEAGPVSTAIGGSGPDLILLHSLLTNRHVYDRVLPDLAEDHTVHTIDLPGFGATAPAEPDVVAYGATIAAYVAGADMDEPPAIIGNGLGGFVTLGALITDQDLFGDVVLAGAGATFPDDARPAFTMMAERATSAGMAAIVDVAVRRIFTEEYLEKHPEEIAERRDVMLETPPAAFATACAALGNLHLVDQVTDIRNRTLILTGSEDAATPPALGIELDGLMPNSVYEELPGIAHGPQLQDPEGFVSTVCRFLDKSAGQGV